MNAHAELVKIGEFLIDGKKMDELLRKERAKLIKHRINLIYQYFLKLPLQIFMFFIAILSMPVGGAYIAKSMYADYSDGFFIGVVLDVLIFLATLIAKEITKYYKGQYNEMKRYWQ